MKRTDEHQEPMRHEGEFADGQAAKRGRDTERPRGRYARGQEQEEKRHEGSFADGQAEHEPHPEDHDRGDFAAGHNDEKDDSHSAA